MNDRKKTTPLGVLLIAGFYIFGAVALLFFLLIDPNQVAEAIALRHGLPASTGIWFVLVITCLAFLIAFGLLSLSRWGYILTIVYLLYFGSINVYLYIEQASWVSLGNCIWSFLVILYLIIVRRRFFKINPVTDSGNTAQTI